MAVENIIVNISARSELQSTLDELVKLGTITAKDAEEFKKLTAETGKLTTETQKATEAAKQSVSVSTSKQAALDKEIAKLKELEILSKKAADPVSAKKFTEAIKGSEAAIKKLNGELLKSQAPVKSLRQAYADAKNEVNRLADASGGRLTPELLKAAKAAAGIKDRISDLNKTLDALNPEAKLTAFIQVGAGISGIFTAAQGAMALLGAESEDVQKALLKVQAALAITQGLNSVLQLGDAFKNLKAVLGITSGAMNIIENSGADIADTFDDITQGVTTASSGTTLYKNATELTGKALKGQAIAAEGATVAQRGLNAAMIANPITALIASLAALLAVYLLLSKSQEENIKLSAEQIEKNNAQAASLRQLRGEVSRIQLEIDKTQGTKTELEFNLAINKLEFEEDLKKLKDDIVVASNKIREEVDKQIDPNRQFFGSPEDIEAGKKFLIKSRVDLFKKLAEQDEFGLKALHEKVKILIEKFEKENELIRIKAQEGQAGKLKKATKVIDVDKKDFDVALSLLNQYFREKDILTLTSGKSSDEINAELFENEVERLRKLIELQDKFSRDSSSTRLELEKKLFIDTSKIQREFEANLNKQNEDRVKANKGALDKMTDDEKKAAEEKAKINKQFQDFAFELAQGFNDLIAESLAASSEAAIQVLQEQKDARLQAYDDELESLQQLNNNKIISDGAYAQKVKEVNKQRDQAEKEANKRIGEEKRKAFIADRIASLSRIAIATAQNAVQQPGPLGAFIPFWIALGALQSAIVLATTIPKFKHGVLALQGKGTETSDSIPAMLSRNESVMTAGETKRFMPTLTAIRKNLISPELLNNFVINGQFGKVEAFVDTHKLSKNSRRQIPYQADMIGRSVAKHLSDYDYYSPLRQ